jgi:hypothetical protein
MQKEHLKEKRNEIIWALLAQGYGYTDIVEMFRNLGHRSTVLRIDAKKPKNYKPKWIKRDDV